MKIRLSYSIMKLWEQSRLEDLANMILGKEIKKTEAMVRGKNFDEYVGEIIKAENRLPDELGGLTLNQPAYQLKIEVPYNELADLVGVFDIYDEPVIYEIKASKNSSSNWLNEYQLDFYMLLSQMKGLKVEKGILYRYDYINKDYDKSILYYSRRVVDEMENRIDSLLPEIHNFISSIKITT